MAVAWGRWRNSSWQNQEGTVSWSAGKSPFGRDPFSSPKGICFLIYVPFWLVCISIPFLSSLAMVVNRAVSPLFLLLWLCALFFVFHRSTFRNRSSWESLLCGSSRFCACVSLFFLLVNFDCLIRSAFLRNFLSFQVIFFIGVIVTSGLNLFLNLKKTCIIFLLFSILKHVY